MTRLRQVALALLLALLLGLMALVAPPQELEAQAIVFPEPTGLAINPPVRDSGSDYSYTISAQWSYGRIQPGAATYRFNVDWNGTVVSAGTNLAASRSFTTPGPVAVRVRLSLHCNATFDCAVGAGGANHTVPKNGGVAYSKWSDTQTVQLPITDEQHPTNIADGDPPAAVVDALVGVSDAFGQPLSQSRAHLWSIFICLLLAIGLAAVSVGATGGGPASVFLGALAFMLVFSLAGPTAFGVPGVFAGLALLLPGLGFVLFLKGKVR